MGQIIVIASGKGGVGKTTTSAAFATGLAIKGHRTVVIDFDVGLRKLDLVMGCELRVFFDITNVISGEATLRQALIRDKRVNNLYILPASQTRDKQLLTKHGLEGLMSELSREFEFVICDSPAGLDQGAYMALYFADKAIVVVNPEVSSVRDSDRIIGILEDRSRRYDLGLEPITPYILINRYDPARAEKMEMMCVGHIVELLQVPLLGIIPESNDVLRMSNLGRPVVLDKDSDISLAYMDSVSRFLGENIEHRFLRNEKSRSRSWVFWRS